MRFILYLLFLLVMPPVTNAQKVESYNVRSQLYPEIYVVGKVHKPAKIFFDGSIKLSQAIQQAGETILSEKQNLAVITLRPVDCVRETVIIMDLQNISTGKDNDIFLQPLDVVSVQPKKSKYKINNSPRSCIQKEVNNNSGIIYGL